MTTITLPDNPELNETLSKSYNELLTLFVNETPLISMLGELYRPKAVVTATVSADVEDPTTPVDVRISYTLKYNPIMPGILNTAEFFEFEKYLAVYFSAAMNRLNEMNKQDNEANPS